jgi:hypothetical protein
LASFRLKSGVADGVVAGVLIDEDVVLPVSGLKSGVAQLDWRVGEVGCISSDEVEIDDPTRLDADDIVVKGATILPCGSGVGVVCGCC